MAARIPHPPHLRKCLPEQPRCSICSSRPRRRHSLLNLALPPLRLTRALPLPKVRWGFAFSFSSLLPTNLLVFPDRVLPCGRFLGSPHSYVLVAYSPQVRRLKRVSPRRLRRRSRRRRPSKTRPSSRLVRKQSVGRWKTVSLKLCSFYAHIFTCAVRTCVNVVYVSCSCVVLRSAIVLIVASTLMLPPCTPH